MRVDSRKIVRPIRPAVEQLEGRMLLSVWAGTWKIQGLNLDAGSGGPAGSANHRSMSLTARVSDSSTAGQYTLRVSGSGVSSDSIILTGDDSLIEMSTSDAQSDEYLKLYFIDPGVLAVVHGLVEYTDPGRQSVDRLSFFGGIATQKAAPIVPFAWDGLYAIHSTSFEVMMQPAISTQWSNETITVVGAPAGAGRYTFGQIGDDNPSLFTPSGKALVSQYAGPEESDPINTYAYEYEQIVRGPYGRLYHVGGFAEFDTTNGQLRSAWFDASYSDPHVNVAPTLNTSGSPYLDAIDEDRSDNSGTNVGELLARGGDNYIYDANGDENGIAVVQLDVKRGKWQYSLNDGGTWLDAGKVTASSALLLAPDARLRFVPNANFFGTLAKAVTFRAWDQSNGTNGGRASVNASAGTTPFSKALDTASLVVNPVNDAPVITGNSVALSYVAGSKPASVFKAMKLFDTDSPYITSARVTFSGGYIPGTDLIAYKGPKTITATIDSAAGTVDLTSASPMKLGVFAKALSGIFYSTPAAHSDVVMTLKVVDKDAFGPLNQSVFADRILHVTA